MINSKTRIWLRVLHRDVGYLAAGLTIIYAISGVAVNHVDDWNPNYVIEKIETSIEPIKDSLADDQAIIDHILTSINEKGTVKNIFKPDPGTLQIFLEGNTVSVDLQTWLVKQEEVTSRAVIRETNFLHLNAPKKVWTYVADVFAVALAFLAISGLFMIKGKKGITGRGAWLTAAGIILPIIFLLLYYY